MFVDMFEDDDGGGGVGGDDDDDDDDGGGGGVLCLLCEGHKEQEIEGVTPSADRSSALRVLDSFGDWAVVTNKER
ncbi:hypothetical protein PoB_005558400 [Plakobranchus ocellatus]|uniref:Uncharacterized protein n=1 Tax=Plakobranchus ocellatus TaxID=259542 RepID=A0AAV4CD80_9GAST|nr:hypothetical protein PoB_005558400 [Plakobranchus ocellatus]